MVTCRNQACAQRAHYRPNRPEQIALGEAELEAFRQLDPEEHDLRPAPHCDLRQIERGFTWRDVRDAVLDGGYVIERRVDYTVDRCRLVVLLLMYWRKGGRPLHVVVQHDPAYPNEWTVRTAYDPSDRPHVWYASDGYEVRHCFCK